MKKDSQFLGRLIVFPISVFAAIVTIGVLRAVLSPRLKEIILDADAGFFTIHTIMWVTLFIGLGELILRFGYASDEERQLRRGYLQSDGSLLTDQGLSDVRAAVYSSRYRDRCFLPRMIIRTIDQYKTNNKVDQASSILNTSLELYMHEIDLRYSILRYITWLIPSLGFIGTVMGIMFALEYAGVPANAESEDFLYQVTSRLGVAFTTTLVALGMAAFLVFLQSVIQSKEEHALNSAGQYCLDNLINQLGGERKL
jgi:biopolymer transport protein ExbB/TolQ